MPRSERSRRFVLGLAAALAVVLVAVGASLDGSVGGSDAAIVLLAATAAVAVVSVVVAVGRLSAGPGETAATVASRLLDQLADEDETGIVAFTVTGSVVRGGDRLGVTAGASTEAVLAAVDPEDRAGVGTWLAAGLRGEINGRRSFGLVEGLPDDRVAGQLIDLASTPGEEVLMLLTRPERAPEPAAPAEPVDSVTGLSDRRALVSDIETGSIVSNRGTRSG